MTIGLMFDLQWPIIEHNEPILMPEQNINCVGIVVKPNHAEALNTAAELEVWLAKRGVVRVVRIFSDHQPPSGFDDDVGLIIVLGGDGTMISTARLVGNAEVPVLGVNYGSLGYLTEFRIEEMYDALDAIFEGNFAVNRREMLTAEHFRGEERLASGRVLNDVVINKAALARIIEMDVRLDGQFVNSFRADGLIVSTPTGSTAYNLSAGGPIVYPSMNAIVITPICPFTLTNRPIVVPGTAMIELELKNGNEGVVLTLDGQTGYTMNAGDRVAIKKSLTTFDLVEPPNRNYFDVLRNKLKWGR